MPANYMTFQSGDIVVAVSNGYLHYAVYIRKNENTHTVKCFRNTTINGERLMAPKLLEIPIWPINSWETKRMMNKISIHDVNSALIRHELEKARADLLLETIRKNT